MYISVKYCHLILQKRAGNKFFYLLRLEKQHFLLPQVQHIPHFGPRYDESFQFTQRHFNFTRNALLDLSDTAALVVRYLTVVRLVGTIIIHGAGPEAMVDFITRYNLLRLFGQEQQIMEAYRLQLDWNAPVEKKLLTFIDEEGRRVSD